MVGHCAYQTSSASFTAEVSVSSPRKLFIFYYLEIYFLDQSSQKIFYLILKKKVLQTSALGSRLAHVMFHVHLQASSRVCDFGAVTYPPSREKDRRLAQAPGR